MEVNKKSNENCNIIIKIFFHGEKGKNKSVDKIRKKM